MGVKTILQWNCQGISNKKAEVCDLIDKSKPEILCVQETMLSKDSTFRIKHYTMLHKEGHRQHRWHGGTAIFIHETIPFKEIPINTPLQAVAAQINVGVLFTIVSIYNSRSHQLNEELLTNLTRQLPSPVIITGDFNGYHPLWGSISSDHRGNLVESFIRNNNLNVLNNGSPTRISNLSNSVIDLSIVSPSLQPQIEWAVSESPLDSDHCLITMKLHTGVEQQEEETSHFNLRRANWTTFQSHPVWDQDIEIIRDLPAETQLENVYNSIKVAAESSIPKVTIKKHYPKPWWSKEVAEARDRRERFYKIYKKKPNQRNLINWKRARAKFKILSIKSKEECWKKFASTINQNTPIAEVWNKIRSIKGKEQKRTIILEENGRKYTTDQEIANVIAQKLSEISDPQNYSQTFQRRKELAERRPLSFSSNNNEVYNREFSLEELKAAIGKTKCSTPGPDEVHNAMLKHLPETGAQILLSALNKTWKEEFFPSIWLQSTIIPIPKPNKCHTNPTNYRPIALTSVLCKIMERMVNVRLQEYLEMKNILSQYQCGGRPKRSTIDQLISLESIVRKAQANNEYLVSIFFDMEKAYDLTWRYGIKKDIHECGLKGRIASFIANFLNTRHFRVRINSKLSDLREQKEGIPQGSVISPTLFILRINKLIKQIPDHERFQKSLFMDDLQVSYRSPDMQNVVENLQNCINNLQKSADENGFKFSTSKTAILNFDTKRNLTAPVTLTLNNSQIPEVDNIKFLGMTWDSKLNWKLHLNKLKMRCNQGLNIMRSVSSNHWGADQRTLMMIYRTLIRSKIDYGCFVYDSAAKQDLRALEVIANEAMRIASGCFKSTPIASLQVITSEAPLQLRRDKLGMKYYYKTRHQPNNPAFRHLTPEHENLHLISRTPPPFSIRIKSILSQCQFEKIYITPNFSYTLQQIQEPTWALPRVKVNFELTDLPKASTPESIYQQRFRELEATKYLGWKHIYTDGSKNGNGVGAAAIMDSSSSSSTLQSKSSIFSAETHAILLAIGMIKRYQAQKFVIFSDSKSVLKAILKPIPTGPKVRQLKHYISDMEKAGKQIELCWIPGHTSIPGNEKVDQIAKISTSKSPELIPCPYTDIYPYIDRVNLNRWNSLWMQENGKLKEVKSDIFPWKERRKSNRRDTTVINRLRTGHTHLTHNYLMEGVATPPPCELCGDHTMTVKHILTECSSLEPLRTSVYGQSKPNGLVDFLGDDKITPTTFQFLKESGIYNRV